MNYKEVLEFMFNSLPMYQRIGQAAYKADLNNTLVLDKYFNYPHKSFKTIHVAGTNGKGSVSHSIASVLQEAGYKTGLYTSPHLVDFRERIRVDGEMVTENFVCDFINNNYKIIQELKPSFFEMSVAMAFEYFKISEVDVAVIEVGMGGRLDSTNVILPELSVITNIGFDHTQFLGKSLDKIAVEKAGIIKKNTPVVIGETQKETKNVFLKIADDLNASVFFADQIYKVKVNENTLGEYLVDKDEESYIQCFDLLGSYQEKNLSTILMAIEILITKGFEIGKNNIVDGLSKVQKNTGLHGRWEVLSTKPLVVCDTAHNKEGLKYVIPQVLSQSYEKLHIVLGFVNDKNVSEVLDLFPKGAVYYFTQASIPRAMSVGDLVCEANKKGLYGKSFLSVKEAYESALQNADTNDMVFVGGSTFVVGDLLAFQETMKKI